MDKIEIEVTIEEIVSQKFKVKVSSLENAYEEVRQMYKDDEIVVENPSLTQANVMIGDDGVWNDLHV